MTAFIRRHPSACYFVLAFALSWGGVLAVILPGPIPAPPSEATRLFARAYLAMLIGPSVAGIAMSAIVDGRTGLWALVTRLRMWRVAPRWYLVALVSAPFAVLVTLAILSRFSPEFVPGVLHAGDVDPSGPVGTGPWSSVLLTGIAIGVGAGFFEELGWTGFATPALRVRYGAVATGLIIGLLWGAWHGLAVFWGSADAVGSMPTATYLLVALVSFLPPYRLLMVRLYERTGSLLVAVLMHASLTSSMIVLGPSVTGGAAVVYNLTLASVLWILAAFALRAPR